MFKSNILSVSIATALGFVASPVLAIDTGDAPESYGTATHEVISNAAHLGDAGPDNNEPVFSDLADGDDVSETDDEDAVRVFPTLVQNAPAYATTVSARNSSGNAAFLSGWIDFDGNGTFDADEFATRRVPANRPESLLRLRLVWPSLTGVTSDFNGPSFARFRVTSLPLSAEDATGFFADGEVEDFPVQILSDLEAAATPGLSGIDTDNDGIPDDVEGEGDTDGDGVRDSLDLDSDNDTIPDFVEAGDNPSLPIDSDGDGTADFVDLDSNADGVPDGIDLGDDTDGDSILDVFEGDGDFDNDGILNLSDTDSDNDLIPDAVEFGSGPSPRDTEGDGVPDFLDLDSDNDGIPDIFESNFLSFPIATLDTDGSGQVDSNFEFGPNGLADAVETENESGILIYTLADSDGDGLRDFMDLDSDADNISDLVEAGAADSDADGLVDGGVDSDGDGLFDGDINFLATNGSLPDVDSDGIADFQDTDADGSTVGEPVTPPENPAPEPEPEPQVTPTTEPEAATPPTDDIPFGTIETGLNGIAGCSVNGTSKEGMLSVMALLSLLVLGVRRRKAQLARNPNNV